MNEQLSFEAFVVEVDGVLYRKDQSQPPRLYDRKAAQIVKGWLNKRLGLPNVNDRVKVLPVRVQLELMVMKWSDRALNGLIDRAEREHLMIEVETSSGRKELQDALLYRRKKREEEDYREIGIKTRSLDKEGRFYLIVEPVVKFVVVGEGKV